MALDESRMLMLGAQILLGFQFQAPFQNAFFHLLPVEKVIELVVLCFMVLVVGLLIAPTARHRIVEQGEATASINRFITRISLITLAPFALALGLDLGIAGTRIGGPWIGAIAGALGGLAALGFWYGPMVLRDKEVEAMPTSNEKTPAAVKIDYALTEARVVLPGAQALLGFQLAIILTTGFAELPSVEKALHGIALGCVALATVLLITPAAYHRIVYGGADVPEFYHVASRFLLAATVFLALGLAADIQVVTSKISESERLANLFAAIAATMLFGLWHLWPWWWRRAQTRQSTGRSPKVRQAPTMMIWCATSGAMRSALGPLLRDNRHDHTFATGLRFKL